MIIAIDGPAGSGKSTVANTLSKRLNFTYLSSGKIYRAVAYHLLTNNIDTDDEKVVEEQLSNIEISYDNEIHLNGTAVEDRLSTEEISNQTSKISKYDFVRSYVNRIINNISNNRDIIMDGRDIGTEVFPNADYKFYLTASAKIRADRRHKELQNKGIDSEFNEIYQSIKKRDFNDSSRKLAPLKKAKDAFEIDSSNKSVEEVVDEMLKIINSN
jgi:cytidylate kinase